MARKDDHNKAPSVLNAQFLKAARRRLLARKALRAGEVEELRLENREKGDPGYRILRYRRVIPAKDYPLFISEASYVNPSTFERHLQYISAECKPILLAELVHRLEEYEAIPDKTVVLTFDGGHRDNFIHAFPLLLKYRIPATFFIPTAYIGTNLYLYEDRVALGLGMLGIKMKMRMPEFAFIEPEVYEAIKKLSPEMAIQPETIALLIIGLRKTTEENRVKVLQFFSETFAGVEMDPVVEDFMRWDDVRYMAKMGFGFGLMGHGHLNAPALTPEQFLQDFLASFNKAKEEDVNPEKIYCFPEGLYSMPALEVLESCGVRFATGIGMIPEPRYQVQLPMLLGRTPMYERVSYCREIFACRLWNIVLNGVVY